MCERAVHPPICICFFRCLCVLRSRHPVCEFCKLFTALAVSVHCWWQWKVCLIVVVLQWKFNSAPFHKKKKKKKAPPTEPSHHTLLGSSSWNSGVCHCFLANSSLECFRSVEEWGILTSGMVSRSIIAPSPLTSTSNHGHSKHMCIFFCFCLYPSSSLWLHLPLFLHLQTSSPVSQPAGEKFLCLVYWIFHPPGAFWQTLTLLSLCFSLTHSLASVQEAWGSRTGLSGITVQAVWHCRMIPTYLSSTPFSLLSFSMSS